MKPPIHVTPAKEDLTASLRGMFESTHVSRADERFFLVTVPLRVCPLGAHSDHQGGMVTGLTIDRAVRLFGQASDQPEISLVSANFPGAQNISLSGVSERVAGDWGNYPRGVVKALAQAAKPQTSGFRGVLHGSMPVGGLSSSAAVTIACARSLAHVNQFSLSPLETIMVVRAVENEYLGLRSGILDQSVIVSGRKDSLICIDCATHEITSREASRTASSWEVLIVYSGLSRQLTATPFNQRVEECHQAARELLSMAGRVVPEKPLLVDAGEELYQRYGERLPETSRRRAKHFFSEAARVREGIAAWAKGDMERFGALVTASGESSIVNYESGSPALISLYEILAETSGVYGTRFCGGGFQGCCLALINPRDRESIAQALHEKFIARHPELASDYSIHFCQSSDSVTVEVM